MSSSHFSQHDFETAIGRCFNGDPVRRPSVLYVAATLLAAEIEADETRGLDMLHVFVEHVEKAVAGKCNDRPIGLQLIKWPH